MILSPQPNKILKFYIEQVSDEAPASAENENYSGSGMVDILMELQDENEVSNY